MHLLPILFISMWSYSKKKKKEDVIETPKETQPKKPISFPHRQCTLLLTILHSDDVNLYFNSQLIITLPLCCLYTGVCNKFRAEIICFSVIERFINMENTQQSIINAGKQQHKYYIFFCFSWNVHYHAITALTCFADVWIFATGCAGFSSDQG